jgi:hypothetical protein
MSTKPIKPRLADNLRLLVASQLQMQAARSAALDGGALGVVAADAAVATIAIDTRGTFALWIIALILIGLSLGLAVKALRLPGAKETGPSVSRTLKARESQDERKLEEWILNDLARDVEINDEALVRKGPLFDRALILLVLAIILELTARL